MKVTGIEAVTKDRYRIVLDNGDKFILYKEEINEEIHVGVGVNYGPAVVGNMGSERRMDYTAIGDTVNTSARLEANAPASTVYISRAVADKLGDRMRYEPLDKPIKLKGKADGFEILRLIGTEEQIC